MAHLNYRDMASVAASMANTPLFDEISKLFADLPTVAAVDVAHAQQALAALRAVAEAMPAGSPPSDMWDSCSDRVKALLSAEE
jgi:hypothetical protein